jgi:hypothetical protein
MSIRTVVANGVVLMVATLAPPSREAHGAPRAELVSARRQGGVTTPWTGGDVSWEVEIRNAQSTALRTHLIVEGPGDFPDSPKVQYPKVPIEIPPGTSKFVPVHKQRDAWRTERSGCHPSTYWLRLEDGAAAPKSMIVTPNCTYSVTHRGIAAAVAGKVSASSVKVRSPFSCGQGLQATMTIKNGTSAHQAVSFTVRDPSTKYNGGAWSPSFSIAPGASATLRTGRFVPLLDRTRDLADPEMEFGINARNASIQNPPGFAVQKTCRPTVALRAGEVPHDFAGQLRKRMPASGVRIVHAYYGRNCGLDWNRASFLNDVARKCDGRIGACAYDFTWANWGGDPSPSLCKKQIDIAYQCEWSGSVRSVKVMHGATPQRVELSCR